MSEIKKVESDDLKIIKVDHVKNLLNAGPIIEKIIKDNPFITPNDENINECETRRKALKKGKTTINTHEKDIVSGLSNARKAIGAKADELKKDIEAAELKQAEANNIYFDNKAWSEALEKNTKEAYVDYESHYIAHHKEAQEKISDIEAAEEKAKQEYQNWSDEMYKLIAAAQNLDDLDKVGQKLDTEDLEKFIDPAEAFETREKLYNIIDINKASFEKLEAERIANAELEKAKEVLRIATEKKTTQDKKRNEELRPYIVFIRDYNALLDKEESEYQKEFAEIKKGAELQREFELKQKKEAAEKAAKEKKEIEKKAEEAKILKQLENYNRALETLELINISIPNIIEIEPLNIFSGKLENIIEKDFGENESTIKQLYGNINGTLINKRNKLNTEIKKQKAIDAQKLQEEQNGADEKRKADADKLKIEQDKKAEAERLKDKEYKEDKNQALEPICDSLATIYIEHENNIKKFNLKDDIIQYISDLLI